MSLGDANCILRFWLTILIMNNWSGEALKQKVDQANPRDFLPLSHQAQPNDTMMAVGYQSDWTWPGIIPN